MLLGPDYQGAVLAAAALFSIGAIFGAVAVLGHDDSSTTIIASVTAVGTILLGTAQVRVAVRAGRGQPDLAKLLSNVLPFARQRLGKNGFFFSFGSTMTEGGKTEILEASPGTPGNQVIDVLRNQLRLDAQNMRIRASALCINVNMKHPKTGAPTHAIQVELEHVGGGAVKVFVPYIVKTDRTVEYGQLFATKVRRTVFGAPSTA